MAFQHGLRPLPGAPVSTPLHWWEVEKGDLRPDDFTMESIFSRLKISGEIYKPILSLSQSLDELLKITES